MGNPTEAEFAYFSKEAATSMLKDIISLYPSHNGIKQKIQSLSKHADLDISAEVDEEFDALYPIEDWEDYENSEKAQRNNADIIVSQWVLESPDYVAEKISTIEKGLFPHRSKAKDIF